MTVVARGYAARRRRQQFIADACYALLKITGWSVVTLACVIAAYALFFLMLGEFRLSGLLIQIDNFGSRYLEADPARQALFERQLGATSLLLFLLIGFLRRWSLLPLTSPHEENNHGSIN
jgi:hypothetical protein